MLVSLSLLCLLGQAALAPEAVSEEVAPNVPLPPQPFTVELLDLMRGRWEFPDALGQYLTLPEPVTAFAYTRGAEGEAGLAWLLCDPEFPEDLAHAVLKSVALSPEGEAAIEEPYLSARVRVERGPEGIARCTLTEVTLGPATTGDRYVAAAYVMVGDRPFPLWLSADASAAALGPRLVTDRVGGVFVGEEPVRVTVAASWPGEPGAHAVALRATEYATGEEVWTAEARVRGGADLSPVAVELPLPRYGIYELTATAEGRPAGRLRVCRIPAPRPVDPDRSAIGINLFQQQIWWYAYQAPLMARAGVHWIRPWLAWENTWRVQEPEEGKWDTRALDSALRRMEPLGLRYQAILWGGPDWLTGGTACGVPPEEKMGAWAAYVERLVTQYRGRIRHWETWNEPDLMWPEETRVAGSHYVAMLRSTYEAAKRADPDCTVLGLSHAGFENWLRAVGEQGGGRWFDIATLHSYAPPSTFPVEIERRKTLLAGGGMADKPIWVNEFGSVAYDESPGYSARYGCSEKQQAARLAALYAECLALSPEGKAFWFCTYDPRDSAHESQWTGDSGIGVLYLGFAPKLSDAALAATAHELDGRRCLGHVRLSRTLHQISFEGPIALVWEDRTGPLEPLAATALGCLPGERLVVRDLYANEIAAGPAADLTLDLARGPVYIEGSAQMAGIARCEEALRLSPTTVAVAPGQSATLAVSAPEELPVEVRIEGLPVECLREEGAIRLAVPAEAPRTTGTVSVAATFASGALGLAAPYTVTRRASVTTGPPNLVRDGGFLLGDTGEWTPERVSPYAWDGSVGCAEPGSLRLDGPFDRRLVHWNIAADVTRGLRLRLKVRTAALDGCLATVNVAAFGADGWIRSWCLARAAAGGREPGWPAIAQPGALPEGTADWTPVAGGIAAGELPPETVQLALFVDVSGGSGTLWLDDLDLYQP